MPFCFGQAENMLTVPHDSGHQPSPPEAPRRAPGPRGAPGPAVRWWVRVVPVRGPVAARQRRDARRAGFAGRDRFPVEQKLRADVHGAAAVPGLVLLGGEIYVR